MGYGGEQWGKMWAVGSEVGAGMFLGTYAPRLDDKGRLALPAKFRSELEGGLVITKGQERCLTVFPAAEFSRITDLLRDAPMTGRRVRDYSRILFSGATQESADAQGRVTIPPALRSYAGLTKDCAVIGANTRVEIWDAAAWETYVQAGEAEFADADEEVLPGLL